MRIDVAAAQHLTVARIISYAPMTAIRLAPVLIRRFVAVAIRFVAVSIAAARRRSAHRRRRRVQM